ncbi:MAG: hypothetical protein HY017_12425 [Betaproteobacteria bacterium]|nr:hypothetical protein [Betaproteobacteria bacterium]
MKRGIVLAWLVGSAAVHAIAEDGAVDLAYKTRYVGEAHGLRNASVFAPGLALTSFGRDRGRFEGEARGRAGPVSLLLTGTVSGQQGQRTLSKLLANEAYVDFGSGENRFTAGKKILSGDVGYAFRPIDVLQREVRLQALPPTLEGIPSLIWERFTADAAWSMVWANPGYRRRSDPRDDGSLALRAYRRWHGADLHGIARTSSRYGTELGGAISAVPHESLELHASFLSQHRGERLAPLADPASITQLLSPDLALRSVTIDSPRKLMGGLTWTVESGWSLLAESWWDGTAPTAGDWSTLAQQAARRSSLLGFPGVPVAAVNGSIAASTALFAAPTRTRRGQLARLAWTDPAASGWSGSFDLLRTPEDGGWVATAAAAWESDRLRFDAGLRRFGGKAESSYRLMPERRVLFAGASYAF